MSTRLIADMKFHRFSKLYIVGYGWHYHLNSNMTFMRPLFGSSFPMTLNYRKDCFPVFFQEWRRTWPRSFVLFFFFLFLHDCISNTSKMMGFSTLRWSSCFKSLSDLDCMLNITMIVVSVLNQSMNDVFKMLARYD